jgi:hypothetical protein
MLLIAASAKAAQFKQVLTSFVSATSVILLQAKQRLSFAVNDNSSHESNGSFEKRSGLEMPVKPNYCAPRLPIILCHGMLLKSTLLYNILFNKLTNTNYVLNYVLRH